MESARRGGAAGGGERDPLLQSRQYGSETMKRRLTGKQNCNRSSLFNMYGQEDGLTVPPPP